MYMYVHVIKECGTLFSNIKLWRAVGNRATSKTAPTVEPCICSHFTGSKWCKFVIKEVTFFGNDMSEDGKKPEDVELPHQMDIRTNVAASATIVLLSTLLNAIVLNIYKRRKKDMSTKFVVALACLDIASCWLLRSLGIVRDVISMSLSDTATAVVVVSICYFCAYGIIVSLYSVVLLMWSLERLLAVAFPFSFQEKLKVFRPVYFVFVVLNLAVSSLNFFLAYYERQSVYAYIGVTILSLLLGILKIVGIVVAYSVIVCLIKLNEKKMAAKRGVGGEAHQAARSKKHKRSMRICIALLLVYLVSYAPFYVATSGIVKHAEFLLIYFINHIANFFVYCATDEKFRDEVRKLLCRSSHQ